MKSVSKFLVRAFFFALALPFWCLAGLVLVVIVFSMFIFDLVERLHAWAIEEATPRAQRSGYDDDWLL